MRPLSSHRTARRASAPEHSAGHGGLPADEHLAVERGVARLDVPFSGERAVEPRPEALAPERQAERAVLEAVDLDPRPRRPLAPLEALEPDREGPRAARELAAEEALALLHRLEAGVGGGLPPGAQARLLALHAQADRRPRDEPADGEDDERAHQAPLRPRRERETSGLVGVGEAHAPGLPSRQRQLARLRAGGPAPDLAQSPGAPRRGRRHPPPRAAADRGSRPRTDAAERERRGARAVARPARRARRRRAGSAAGVTGRGESFRRPLADVLALDGEHPRRAWRSPPRLARRVPAGTRGPFPSSAAAGRRAARPSPRRRSGSRARIPIARALVASSAPSPRATARRTGRAAGPVSTAARTRTSASGSSSAARRHSVATGCEACSLVSRSSRRRRTAGSGSVRKFSASRRGTSGGGASRRASASTASRASGRWSGEPPR